MLRKSKLNVGCKKVESRMQTQMTNTKCSIDCAKYNVNWNIEFWRNWNAIDGTEIRVNADFSTAVATESTRGTGDK